MFDRSAPFFARDFMVLKLLAATYVAALVVAHSTLPGLHIWMIAAFFSVIMNFTYPWAALKTGRCFGVETWVATALIVLALVGLWLSPILVIASIFGHGAWDLAKHLGAGVPIFSWYTWGCVAVDWTYAAILCLYWISVL